MDNTLEIAGLAGVLSAEEEGTRVDLRLGCNGRRYRAEIVRVSSSWILRVRDEQGWSVTDANGSRMTLESALGCAILDVLRDSRGMSSGSDFGAPRKRSRQDVAQHGRASK